MRTTVKIACALMLLLLSVPCMASPPEIQNFTFTNSQTASWSADAAASGYNVYLGTASSPGGPRPVGCYLGSWHGTDVAIAKLPAPGQVDFYLVAGLDPSGTGTLGSASGGAPRQPAPDCVPSRRSFPLVVSTSPDGLTDMEPPVNPDVEKWSSTRESTGVVLSSGEFVYNASFALIRNPGRANGGLVSRSSEAPSNGPHYRSRTSYDGPLGFGWDDFWNAHLTMVGDDLYLHDGTGRVHKCVKVRYDTWTAPAALTALIIQDASGRFTLRTRTGHVIRFDDLNGSNKQGAITSFTDADGNTSSFLYDHQGLLRTIVDVMGRPTTLEYDATGRVTRMTDFTGHAVLIGHDFDGNLSSITTPPVTGTPTGNDFPAGKTTRFRYETASPIPQLRHNILGITAPNQAGSQVEFMQITYGTALGTFSLDRVASQMIGGSQPGQPPAGGRVTFTYQPFSPGPDPNDAAVPRRKTTVVDRLGNQAEHQLNLNGHLLELTERTNRDLRPGEPDYTTLYDVRADGRITMVTWPAGNRTLLTYDTSGLDVYRAGNVLELREVADQPAAGGRGDGRGGTLADRIWTWTYEPLRNQVATATDPRGNDPTYAPPNGGSWSAARYRTSWIFEYQEGDPNSSGLAALAAQYQISLAGVSFGLGDLNGDGITNRTSAQPAIVENKKVLLAGGSNQAGIEGDTLQDRRNTFLWDTHECLVAVVDAEGNRHEMTYYSELDPDGDGVPTPAPPDGRALDPNGGGYLRTMINDVLDAPGRDNGTNPPHVSQRTDLKYDPRGNVVAAIDPRGVMDRWTYNQLDQLVEEHRAVATADAGTAQDPPTGRGEAGLSPLGFRTRRLYDANDNLVSVQREDAGATRGLGPFIAVTRSYDLLDNLIAVDKPVSPGVALQDAFRYDANENLVTRIHPETNTDTWAYDERGLLLTQTLGATGPLGGTARVWRWGYDGNRNLTSIVDGNGNPMDFLYDGGDRLVRIVDQLGSTLDVTSDVADFVVRGVIRGTLGGQLPSNRSGATNVDLNDTRYLYDEAGRLAERRDALFVPSGAQPFRPPQLAEGPLSPGDGFVNTRFEYDRLDRPTFTVQDSGATTRDDYDGLSRTVRVTDSTGDPVDLTVDAAGNLIESTLTESSSTPGPPAQKFVSTHYYDALGQPTMSVDPIGAALRWQHDSLGMMTRAWDALGPVTLSIQRRAPSQVTVVPINSFGNLTKYEYDGLDRLVRTAVRLSPGGVGDGTPDPALDGNNPQIPDGEINTASLWNGMDQPIRQSDDAGNEIDYTYDNQGRLVQVMADDGATTTYGWDGEDCRVFAIDPNGEELASVCDAAGRVRHSYTVCNPCEFTRAVDQSFEYDGLGRLTRAVDLNDPIDPNDEVQVSWIYDSLSRSLEETQTITDGSAPQRTDWGWAAADRNTQMTYPGGQVLSYVYDAADRVVGVNTGGGASFAQMGWFGRSRLHTRSFTGGVRTTTLDNAGTTDMGYDAAGRLTRVRHLNGLNELLAGFEYGYDRDDNRVSERRLHYPVGLGGAMGLRWSHDSAGRLVSWRKAVMDAGHVIAGPVAESQDWQLDGQGNWVSWQRSGSAFTAASDDNNAYHDFAGQSPTHDLNGNMVFDGLHDLEYDALGRLVSASRSSDGLEVQRNLYDAMGRRVRQHVAEDPGVARDLIYVYGGQDLVEEQDGQRQLQRRVVRQPDSGMLLAQSDRGNKVSLLLADGQGSTVAVVDRASSLVRERVTYDAQGTPYFEAADNTPELDPNGAFRRDALSGVEELFQGMHYDPATSARFSSLSIDRAGTYMLLDRVYSPYMGRFTSRDPIGVWGDSANAGNGYAFAGGNPGTMGDTGGLRTYAPPHVFEQRPRLSGWSGSGCSGGAMRASFAQPHVFEQSTRLSGGGGGGGCGGVLLRTFVAPHVFEGREISHSHASDASAGGGSSKGERVKTFSFPHVLETSGRLAAYWPHMHQTASHARRDHIFQHNESDFDFLYQHNQTDLEFKHRAQMNDVQSNPMYKKHQGQMGNLGSNPLYVESNREGVNPLYQDKGVAGENPFYEGNKRMMGRFGGKYYIMGCTHRVVDRFTGAEVWNQPTGFARGPRQTVSMDGSWRVIPVPWVPLNPALPHARAAGSQSFNCMTNVQKSKHDAAMAAIQNTR